MAANRWIVRGAATALAMGLVACAGGPAEQVLPPSAADETIEITVQPIEGADLEAGRAVELVYEVDTLRGLPHVLQRWDGSEWRDHLLGVATEDRGRALSGNTPWVGPDEPISSSDIGFEGRGGGLFLHLPAEAAGLVIRLCARQAPLCSGPLDLR